MRVIGALQESWFSVAMTGDGVNDAPALQERISVWPWASGEPRRRGTVRTIILTDDNFATIRRQFARVASSMTTSSNPCSSFSRPMEASRIDPHGVGTWESHFR